MAAAPGLAALSFRVWMLLTVAAMCFASRADGGGVEARISIPQREWERLVRVTQERTLVIVDCATEPAGGPTRPAGLGPGFRRAARPPPSGFL